MVPYCPLVGEEELLVLMGAALDINRAGGANDPIGRPAGDGLDHGEGNNLPVNTSSDEEEEGEYETGHVDRGQGEFIHPLSSSKDEEDEDSGYGSDCEDEEDCLPVPAGTPSSAPSSAPFGVLQQLIPAQHQESAPSASGLRSSTKRSRDDSHTEQVSRKRQRRNPAPSGLGFSRKRSREESLTELMSTKKQRRNCEDSSEDSAPSSSGPVFSSTRSSEEDYRDSAPSTSSGLVFSSTRSSKEDYWDSAPSTSGLCFSSTRSSEEDYWDSAPSTSSGFVFSSTCWRDPSFYRWADDSDSD